MTHPHLTSDSYACLVRILVVEDELRMAALLKRGLGEEGYAVDVSTTGPDALQRASDSDYSAVLLDVMLPGMTGLEVCRKLARTEAMGAGAHPQRT